MAVRRTPSCVTWTGRPPRGSSHSLPATASPTATCWTASARRSTPCSAAPAPRADLRESTLRAGSLSQPYSPDFTPIEHAYSNVK